MHYANAAKHFRIIDNEFISVPYLWRCSLYNRSGIAAHLLAYTRRSRRRSDPVQRRRWNMNAKLALKIKIVPQLVVRSGVDTPFFIDVLALAEEQAKVPWYVNPEFIWYGDYDPSEWDGLTEQQKVTLRQQVSEEPMLSEQVVVPLPLGETHVQAEYRVRHRQLPEEPT
jgi:hypothetical protein